MGCTLSPIWTVFDGIRNLGSVLKYRPRAHDGGTRGGTWACVLWTLVGVYNLPSLTCAGKPSYEWIVRPVIRLRIWAKTRRIRQLVWCEWTQLTKERNLHRIRLLQNYPSCNSLSMDKESPQHATKLAKYSGMSKQRCFFILLIGSSKSICRWLNYMSCFMRDRNESRRWGLRLYPSLVLLCFCLRSGCINHKRD